MILAGACTGSTEDDGRATAPSTATQERPAPAPAAAATATPDEPSPTAQPASYRLTIERVDAARGEDGAGSTVAANDPRALLVHAESWPGRALDPVLHVGQLQFHHYDYPSKGVLRFVVADAALLTAGAEVALQYGDDERSRVVIAPALEVQP